jgi:hypothetical protein
LAEEIFSGTVVEHGDIIVDRLLKLLCKSKVIIGINMEIEVKSFQVCHLLSNRFSRNSVNSWIISEPNRNVRISTQREYCASYERLKI